MSTTKDITMITVCEASKKMLRVIDLDKKWADMNKEERETLTHYLNCPKCTKKGLDEILGSKTSCIEACLAWAELPIPWVQPRSHPCLSVRNLRAGEHVYGIVDSSKMSAQAKRTESACQETPCDTIWRCWEVDWPALCSQMDDEAEAIIYIAPRLIKFFIETGWPLEELLAVQEKRIADLLEDLKHHTHEAPHVTPYGHTDISQEVMAHFNTLREIYIASVKTVKEITAEKEEMIPKCLAATMLLRIMDRHKDWEDMTEEERNVLRHYLNCWECSIRGLDEILGSKMSCEEAKELAPKVKIDEFTSWHFNVSISVVQAAEHFYGTVNRKIDDQDVRISRWSGYLQNQCAEDFCRKKCTDNWSYYRAKRNEK